MARNDGRNRIIRGSRLPFLNGMPNYLLDPGRDPRHPAPSRDTIRVRTGEARITNIGPTVQVNASRHPCEARTTQANLLSWTDRALKLRPATQAAAALYPDRKSVV